MSISPVCILIRHLYRASGKYHTYQHTSLQNLHSHIPLYSAVYIHRQLHSFYTDETIEEEVTDMKEDGDTIIIQTKVPEELTQSALNSQGDGESYTEGDWISMVSSV